MKNSDGIEMITKGQKMTGCKLKIMLGGYVSLSEIIVDTMECIICLN
jgi:hypothetical protein